MSLKLPERLFSTLGFRVGAWYSVIFVASTALLFLLGYLFLGATLRAHDEEEIQLELREVKALYEIGGVTALNSYLEELSNQRRSQPLFIRVADSKNRTRHVFARKRWYDFDLKLLEIKDSAYQGWITLESKDGEYVLDILSGPLTPRGNRVQVGMSSQRRALILGQYKKIALLVMAPLFVLGLGGGLFLSRKTLRPIRDIIQTVRSIDAGTMEARLSRTHTGDELDELARLFNSMLESIHRLIQGMESSLDNVAHDLRTPMTRLRNFSELALKEESPELLKEALEKGMEESERILSLLTTLMDLSEAETGRLKINPEPTNLTELVETVAEMYRFVGEEKGVEVSWKLAKEIFMKVDPQRMSQAVANIMDNAVKFTPEGRRVRLSLEKKRHQVVIRVEDEGPGIPEADLSRIWDRLFRGDRSRSQKGLGLGLSLVKGIVVAHHGTVSVKRSPQGGACFEVSLPFV